MLESVLVANRGEIARRIIATTRRLGIRAVAVYSEADAGLPFVREADQAVQILGGMGFMRGTQCERIYREVKVMTIGGGAEEIMKDLAARQWGL